MHRPLKLLVSLFLFVAIVAFASADDNPPDTTSLKGKPAPDLSLTQLDGKKFDLASQRGSVVVLDYWATWCAPCIQSLPHLEEMSQDKTLAAKGLKMFANNDQEATGDVDKFVKAHNLTLAVPLDPAGDFEKKYLVQSMPTTVIVGRDGVIREVIEGFGPDKIKDAVNKALDEKVGG